MAWILHPGPYPSGIPCHSVTQVHGCPSAINSYQAELQGLHALLLAVNHICVSHQLNSSRLTIGCDNQGVLHHVRHPSPYVPCTVKHADLVCAIHVAYHQCPIQLPFQYIIANHQYKLTCFKDLPLLTQLNVQADHMAKQALYSILGKQASPLLLSPLPGVPLALAIQNLPVSSDPCAKILHHLGTQMAIPYCISKGHLTPSSADLVNWTVLAHALSSHAPTYWMWLFKFASKHSAAGIMMHHCKKWDSPWCPIFHLIDKDTNHIFLCSDADHTATGTN